MTVERLIGLRILPGVPHAFEVRDLTLKRQDIAPEGARVEGALVVLVHLKIALTDAAGNALVTSSELSSSKVDLAGLPKCWKLKQPLPLECAGSGFSCTLILLEHLKARRALSDLSLAGAKVSVRISGAELIDKSRADGPRRDKWKVPSGVPSKLSLMVGDRAVGPITVARGGALPWEAQVLDALGYPVVGGEYELRVIFDANRDPGPSKRRRADDPLPCSSVQGLDRTDSAGKLMGQEDTKDLPEGEHRLVAHIFRAGSTVGPVLSESVTLIVVPNGEVVAFNTFVGVSMQQLVCTTGQQLGPVPNSFQFECALRDRTFVRFEPLTSSGLPVLDEDLLSSLNATLKVDVRSKDGKSLLNPKTRSKTSTVPYSANEVLELHLPNPHKLQEQRFVCTLYHSKFSNGQFQVNGCITRTRSCVPNERWNLKVEFEEARESFKRWASSSEWLMKGLRFCLVDEDENEVNVAPPHKVSLHLSVEPASGPAGVTVEVPAASAFDSSGVCCIEELRIVPRIKGKYNLMATYATNQWSNIKEVKTFAVIDDEVVYLIIESRKKIEAVEEETEGLCREELKADCNSLLKHLRYLQLPAPTSDESFQAIVSRCDAELRLFRERSDIAPQGGLLSLTR
jgi:hypothetical protein